jgi:hypothetical protein
MSRKQEAPRSDPEFNPYAAPRAPLGPDPVRSGPTSQVSPGAQGPISVTHELTDRDLRRFADCDAFYDPMPLFGFIPQWFWLILITVCIGFVFGIVRIHSFKAALVSGPVFSSIVFALLVFRANAMRNSARLAGLCEKRILTIAPQGLKLTIPGVRAVPQTLGPFGPLEHAWADYRKIEAMEEYIFFWLTGRSRLVLPRQAFTSPGDADAFLQAANRWHAEAD